MSDKQQADFDGLPIGVGCDDVNKSVVIEIGPDAEGEWSMTPTDARKLASVLIEAADSVEQGAHGKA